MLSPLAIATWISFCTPWAEPRSMSALIAAGSGGEPYLITDAAGQAFTGKTAAEAIRHLRQMPATGERFIGLAQLPASKLVGMGLSPEVALDICANLEIAQHWLQLSNAQAAKIEKSPWKQVAATYSVYRIGKAALDQPFAQKAVEHLMRANNIGPAPITHPLYHEISAQWAAGMALRLAGSNIEVMAESARIAHWARRKY